MTTTLYSEGLTIDHAHTAAVTSGEAIKIGGLVAVASNAAASGVSIPYYVTGVHRVAKVSAAVITKGLALNWDNSNSALGIGAAAAGDIANQCVAWEAKGAGTTDVLAKLNTGNSVVT